MGGADTIWNVVSTFASIPDWWAQQTATLQVFWSIGFCGFLLIALQGLLSVFIGHHDINLGSHESSWNGYISLKTISAMFLGVGFGGAMFGQYGFSVGFALAGGIGIGFFISALFFVLMKGLYQLRSDGTAMLWEAIGQRGTVYMRIPGQAAAPGEIQVAFAGRLMNVPAFTRGSELATGTDVLVISVHGEHALEVEKVSKDQLTLS
jgi:hypothetical protein